jgi:hypothetical protein
VFRVDVGAYCMHDYSLEENKKRGQVSDLRVLLRVKMSCHKPQDSLAVQVPVPSTSASTPAQVGMWGAEVGSRPETLNEMEG